jgi:hypothetical protein
MVMVMVMAAKAKGTQLSLLKPQLRLESQKLPKIPPSLESQDHHRRKLLVRVILPSSQR